MVCSLRQRLGGPAKAVWSLRVQIPTLVVQRIAADSKAQPLCDLLVVSGQYDIFKNIQFNDFWPSIFVNSLFMRYPLTLRQ